MSIRFITVYRITALLAATVSLAACSIPPGKTDSGKTESARPALNVNINPSQSARACYAELGKAQVNFSPLPNQYFGGGCSQVESVMLANIGTDRNGSAKTPLLVSNLGAVTCQLAQNFAGWAQYGVARAARQMLGSDLVRIETMGSYSCRNVAGSARLSEHAHANAIDVSAFVLADGRRITVADGWNGSPRERAFLQAIHDSACKRFGTVLSPDYNSAHRDHFHLDMSGKDYCR